MDIISSVLKKFMRNILALIGLKISRIYPNVDVFPVEATAFHREVISRSSKYSMTGLTRMWALTNSFEYIQKNNVPGDYVECGVWQGGNLILLAALQDSIGANRVIYGFDTFSGMTNPTANDVDYKGNSATQMLEKTKKIDGQSDIHAFASLSIVKKNLLENNSKNVKLIQGDVCNTLLEPENLPSKIAILRLDTDWYESTKIELEILYPLLVSGGVLIIDDYGHHQGARKAVDEYFQREMPWMHYIDYTCRLIVKK